MICMCDGNYASHYERNGYTYACTCPPEGETMSRKDLSNLIADKMLEMEKGWEATKADTKDPNYSSALDNYNIAMTKLAAAVVYLARSTK